MESPQPEDSDPELTNFAPYPPPPPTLPSPPQPIPSYLTATRISPPLQTVCECVCRVCIVFTFFAYFFIDKVEPNTTFSLGLYIDREFV